MVIYGKDNCCNAGFGTLVGVSVFSVIWFELLITYDISCAPWSSVYECQTGVCVHISGED